MAMSKIKKRIDKKFKVLESLVEYINNMMSELDNELSELQVEKDEEDIRHNLYMTELNEQTNRVNKLKKELKRFI